jgi:hypothetical protein
MTNRSSTESPLRDLAAIWQRFKAWFLDIQGWVPGHNIKLSKSFSLKIAERWVELQTDAEGPRHRLTRAEAALFVRHSLDVLAAKERCKIVVSDELCVVVDAKTVRIPQTLFQKLGYRFITPEHVIFSFDCVTFRYWAALNRAEVEAGLKEADGWRAAGRFIKRDVRDVIGNHDAHRDGGDLFARGAGRFGVGDQRAVKAESKGEA